MRGQYQMHISGLGPGEASLESLGQGMADFSQSALSSELSSTVIESDNPFADSSGSPLQSREHYQEFSGSPLRPTGHPNQNTAFSDEPKGLAMPSESWKLPRCLSRSSSAVCAAESSPLRWYAFIHLSLSPYASEQLQLGPIVEHIVLSVFLIPV